MYTIYKHLEIYCIKIKRLTLFANFLRVAIIYTPANN